MNRVTSKDIQNFRSLIKKGYNIKEISAMTGFSRTVVGRYTKMIRPTKFYSSK